MGNILRSAAKIIEKLEKNGYKGYIAGGCVRDTLLGIDRHDLDIATDALPRQTAEIFARRRCTGERHGGVKVEYWGVKAEITTFREDGEYSDFRRPDRVRFVSRPDIDSRRRDFTINAMYMDKTGNVLDFHGGKEDLKNGIIRIVGEPEKRLLEDPLRIMRGVRFAAVLGFEIEENTLKAMRKNKDKLNLVSGQRLYRELKKALMGDYIKKALLDYSDIFGRIMAPVNAMKGFDQKNIHHIYDVLTHTAVVVENTPKDPCLRVAALMHDFGKPEAFFTDRQGVGHFWNHHSYSLVHAQNLMKKFNVSKEERELICHLVHYHDVLIQPEKKAVLKALNKHGEHRLRLLLALKRADNKGQNTKDFDRSREYDRLESLIDLAVAEKRCFSLDSLGINGDDIVSLGIPPGPRVGRLLKALLEQVLEENVENTPERLTEKAKELIENGD